MKNKTAIKRITFVIILISLSFFAVYGAQCAGQSCTTNTSVTISNIAPVISYVNFSGSHTGTGYAINKFDVYFNVTDSNLNDSSAISAIANASNNFSSNNASSNTTCAKINQVGSDVQYNCTIHIPYHFHSGTWFVNVSVCDTSNLCVSNSTTSFIINALDYINSSNSSIVWSSVYSGTNNNEANNTIIFSNGGNQKYLTLNVTAYNSTGASTGDVIRAENYSIDNASGAPSETQLVANTSTNWPDFSLDKCPYPCLTINQTDEAAYIFVDVKSELEADTYSSISNWQLSITS